MAVLVAVHALYIIWILVAAPQLSNAKIFCAQLDGPGLIADSALGVSVSSKQLQGLAASWQEQPQQQGMLNPPLDCHLHACIQPGTGSTCQLRHVTELDPLQTGVLLLELSSLHAVSDAPPQQPQHNSSNAPTRESIIPDSTRAATPTAAAASTTASAASSITFSLAASCTARTYSSTGGQANSTPADASQEQHTITNNSTAAPLNNYFNRTSQQHTAQEAHALWTETVQVTLLQRHFVAPPTLQDCPAGAAAATVWLVPDFPVTGHQPDDCYKQESNSTHCADGHQQKQQEADSLMWHGFYEDGYDADYNLVDGTDINSAAMPSRTLVMLDLLLPDIPRHWLQVNAAHSSNSSEHLASSTLAQADNVSSLGHPDQALTPARPANAGNAWLWFGRLLLVSSVVGLQLAWHHHTNK